MDLLHTSWAQVTAVDCDGASLAQLRQREDKVKIVQMDLEEALACWVMAAVTV